MPWNPLQPTSPAFPIVVSGPSGVGKTVLVKKLIELDPALVTSISATSRPMREGETDGVHYHFYDVPRFEALLGEQGFLEHARVHGHYYGTPRGPLEAHLAGGRGVVLNIDVQGARQVRASRPDAVLVFILPPSREALEERLRRRATDSDAEIRLRLQNALGEIEEAVRYDYAVVNDDVDAAGERLLTIVRAERMRVRRMRDPGHHEA